MAKFQHKDIIQSGNPFEDAEKGLKSLLEIIDKSTEETKAFVKQLSEIARKGSTKEVKDVTKLLELKNKLTVLEKRLAENKNVSIKATKQISELEKQRIKVGKDLNTQLAKNITLRSAQNKGLETAKILNQKRLQIDKASIKTDLAAAGSIEKLRLKTADLVRERDKLGDISGKNAKQFQKLTTSIAKNEAKLKSYDTQIGKSQRKVGDYGRALGGLRNLFIKGLGILGLTAGVQGLANAFRKTITIFSGFSQAASKLQAITGGTTKEIKKLTDQAKFLGNTTQKTAQEVLQLQIEYSKLGFGVDEIEAATEATLALSIATGEGLAISAEVAGATLKGFGLETIETQRVVDVMAASFSNSALTLTKFQESMKLVAPIASAANIDLETTTALLGRLADAGLAGSIAGTGLKNILSKLSNENSALSKELGFTVKNSEDLIKAFKLLEKGNIDLTKATELTDERSKAAFITMIRGVDSIEKLKTSLDNAEGSALRMATIMADNLAGDTDKAKSAMEGLAIVVGEKLEPGLRRSVQAFTRLINKLSDTRTKGRQLSDELVKQNNNLQNLEKNIIPLLDRYDELSSSTSLNTEEQIELEEIIQKIVEVMPDAVTEFNTYGEAVKINTGIVRNNVDAQRELVKLLSEKTPGELLKDLKSLGLEAETLKRRLEIGDLVTKSIKNVGAGYTLVKKRVKLTGVEAANVRTEYIKLNEEIKQNIEALQLFAFAGVQGVSELKKEVKDFSFAAISSDARKAGVSTATVINLILNNIIALQETTKRGVVDISDELDKESSDFIDNEISKQEKAVIKVLERSDEYRQKEIKAQGEHLIEVEKITEKHKERIAELEFEEFEEFEELQEIKFNDIIDGNEKEIQEEIEQSNKEVDITIKKNKRILKEEKEAAKREVAIAKEKTAILLQGAAELIRGFQSLANVRTQNELKEIDKRKDDALKGFQGTSEQRANIEAKFEAEKLELQEAAFKRNQKIAIAEALINGAIAITSALKFTFLSSILIPLIIASTSLQVATIATQKFKDGVIGYEGEGSETSDSNVVSISDKESIIKAKSSKQSTELLTAINEGYVSDRDFQRWTDFDTMNNLAMSQIQTKLIPVNNTNNIDITGLIAQQKITNDLISSAQLIIPVNGEYIAIDRRGNQFKHS